MTNLTHLFMYLFISCLYMFWASQRSSSWDRIVLIVTVFPPDRHTKQSLTQTNHTRWCINTIQTPDDERWHLKRVEIWNKSSSRLRYSPGWALASSTIRLQASIPCSVSPFIYTHLSQVHGHVIQPSHFWSSSSSCCIQLSVHLFWDCGVLHSIYMTKPSHSLAFNKPDNVLPLDYGF